VSYRSLPPEAKSIIGFVPDSQEVIGSLSGNEYLQFLRGIYRLGEEEWAAVAGWAELLKIGPQLDQLMETYSHGQRKKVQLIGALLHRPALLLLDEPLSGLDPEMAAIVKALLRGLRERGVGVLLSTHDLLAAEALCDRALFLDQGRIVASGECEALRARYTARNLEDAFLSAIGVADRLSEVEHVLAGF
jgi:ABC-2 type transport system ATP-binding protein